MERQNHSYDSRRAYDRYEPGRQPPPPRVDDRPPPPPPQQDSEMFRFRGAATRPRERDGYAADFYRPGGFNQGGDNYRSGGGNHRDNGRSHDFNFQAGNAPSFAPSTDYPSARRAPRPQQGGRRRDNTNPRGGRGGRGGRGRGRGGFVPRRAGDREILRAEREPTPEQLPGMGSGHTRFKAVNDMSDSESEGMDLATPSEAGDEGSQDPPKPADTYVDSDSEGEHPRAKRARVRSPEPAQEAKPKWSNPDPYTVLPPTDETLTTGKKKDVVKLIRKAKLEAAKPDAKTSTASDFISLNFDDDEAQASASESGEVLSASDSEHGEDADPAQRTLSAKSSFSHLDNLHPDRVSATPQGGLNMALPAGRLDVWPPPPPAPNSAVGEVYGAAVQKQNNTDTTATTRQRTVQKNKKRKAYSQDYGDIVDEWIAPEQADPAPWLKLDKSRPPSLADEILDFYDYVKPRDFEEHIRQNLIQRVQQSIQRDFAGVQIKAFGSFAAGMYLPTADMDLVALSPEFLSGRYGRFNSYNQMRKFSRSLENANMIKPGSLTVISKARVPLVKFVDNKTGLRVDISFDNNSGIVAQKTFEEWKQHYPAMPIIVSLIKQFLVMRGMSEVFTGGLGGYSVICLVVSTIRRLQTSKGPEWDQMHNLDLVLMEFLIHFGEEFSLQTLGIQMEPYNYISKSYYNPVGRKKPQLDRLLIIDPNNYDNDISGGSSNVKDIFEAFRKAGKDMDAALDTAEEFYDSGAGGPPLSILERVWGGNYAIFETQRAHLKAIWDREFRPGGMTQPARTPGGRTTQAAITAPVTTAPNRAGQTQSNKRRKTTAIQGKAGTEESPIDLGDSEGEAKGQSDYAPTFQAINKPKTHQGPKHKGSIKQPNVNSGSHTPKGEAVKKEKKKKARDDAKKPLEAQRDKMAMASRATAFKKAHPGVNCPKKLSREQFKDLTKKHGAGNAS